MKNKILLIAGGYSNEKDVSLLTAKSVLEKTGISLEKEIKILE